jgi:hypothetical protein
VKPLVPENVNVNVSANTGAVADLAELSTVVADNLVYVMGAFTVCSIVRTIFRRIVIK